MKTTHVVGMFTGTVILYVAMGACSGSGADPWFHQRDAGALLDAMTDVVPSADAESGDGTRLKAMYYLGDDGSRHALGVMYDSQRGERCMYLNTPDGMRCIPSAETAITWYEDTGCSAPLGSRGKSECYQSDARYAYAPVPAGPCGAVGAQAALYPTVAKVTPATVYQKDAGGGCKAVATSGNTEFYTLGPAIPWDSFVKVTEQHD
jgi:hypothetical protein